MEFVFPLVYLFVCIRLLMTFFRKAECRNMEEIATFSLGNEKYGREQFFKKTFENVRCFN